MSISGSFSVGAIVPGVFTKTGAGTLSFTGPNSYSGGTNLSGGTLAVENGGNLGTGPLSFHGASLEALRAGGGIFSAAGILLQGGGGAFLAQSGTTSILSGVLSGPGAFTKMGPGSLVLTGANTYSGGTNIEGGVVVIQTTAIWGPVRSGFMAGSLTYNLKKAQAFNNHFHVVLFWSLSSRQRQLARI